MDTKLNQIIAVVNGKKTRFQKSITEIYHRLQKAELFHGLSRKYSPLDDEGETLPSETTLVKVKASEVVEESLLLFADLIDLVATQDYANCEAKADIVVDDRVLVEKIPVTHLLFLEKQLNDLHTFVEKLPTLDPSENWIWDSANGTFHTIPAKSNRTKKVLKNHVLYEATKEHPAQVQTYAEDVKVGEWETTKFSGSIEPIRKTEMLKRVRKLQDAVKKSRETANNLTVTDIHIGEKVLGYIFEK